MEILGLILAILLVAAFLSWVIPFAKKDGHRDPEARGFKRRT